MTFLAFIRLLSYCGISSSVAQIAAPRVCAHIRQMHLCCKFYMSQVPIHLLDNGSIHFSRIPRRTCTMARPLPRSGLPFIIEFWASPRFGWPFVSPTHSVLCLLIFSFFS